MPLAPSDEPKRKARGGSAKAFLARLQRGDLTPDDQERVALAKAIKEGRAANLTYEEIARRLGVKRVMLTGFVNGPIYDAALQYLDWLAGSDEDRARARREKEEREEFFGFGKDALAFLRDAFRRSPVQLEGGEVREVWESPAMAQWATERVMRGKGWDQPVQDRRPVIQINVEMKERVGTSILADDERLALPAPTPTLDLSPEAIEGELADG